MLRNARIKNTTVEKKEFPAQKFQYFRYSSQLEQQQQQKKKSPEFLSLDFPAGWEFWLFVSFCQSFHLPAEEHAKAKAKGLEKIGALVCRRHLTIILLPVSSVWVCSRPCFPTTHQNEFYPASLSHSPTPLCSSLPVLHPLLHLLGH